jgi:fermentation-respiration switch protein FrsA (DUF1100 family)
MARALKIALRWLLLALFGYALLCLLVYLGQRRLLYQPDALPLRQAEAIGAETLQLQAEDGTALLAWWLAPPDDKAPVALYLHGNGANLDARAARFQALHEDGVGVLALSWRGYGGSGGTPSEAGWALDARAAYVELRRRGILPERILLYGESLGSTHAVMLAAEQPVAGLLLDSSFDSALALAGGHYPLLPLRWLMTDPHRADLAAPKLQLPVLQVHCRGDTISPLRYAEQLQQRFGRRSELLVLDGECHVPSYARYREPAKRWLRQFGAAPG